MQMNFDATQVAPDAGFETVPAGWYNVAIDDSEMKPTNPKPGEATSTGAYMQVRFTILDGQYAGRKLFARLNLKNSNQQTVEIAYKQLSAICHAVGVLRIQDSAQLHGIPLKVKVKLRTDPTGKYEDQNDITSFKNINEQVDVAGSSPAGGFNPGGNFAAPANPFGQPGQQAAIQQAAGVQQAPAFQPPQGQSPQGGFQQPMQPAPIQQAPPFQQAPAQQFIQPQPQQQQPQQDPAQQPWAGGGAQQPWAQAPVQQPPQQQQAPAQQAPHPAQQATPPWAQQG